MTGNHEPLNQPKVEYTVIIKKTLKNVPFKNREYEKISETGGDDGKGKFGYVYFDDVRDETKDVFEQTVNELDVQSVIKAVNGL